MDREALREMLRSDVLENGGAAFGAVRRSALEPVMNGAQQARLERQLPGWRAVLCAAFPYYVDIPGAESAISRYAWGMDYHLVIEKRLEPAARRLREQGAAARVLVDASPVPERAAALLSGVGLRGDNGLLILPPWGSYLFIGTVVTDADCFDDTEPPERIAECVHCGACRSACPGGALGEDGFHRSRCLSNISQKKGELTDRERELLLKNRCLWGCDVCQNVCPYNRAPRETEIPEFRDGLTLSLCREQLEGLSNRAFQRRFADRAFAWRGVGVLLRNLDILEGRFPAGPVT